MLKSIKIKNFTIIDELEVDFSKGLNIITGETGAGKSILIDAIDVVLGAKPSREQIKKDCEKAYIELVVEVKNQFKEAFLEEIGLESSDEYIFSREISNTTSRSRVNGVLISSQTLLSLREKLLDIHSQHQTYSFLNPKIHIDVLDSYGENNHKSLVLRVKELYENYLAKSNLLEKLKSQNSDNESRLDFLNFQINEINSAKITDVDELETLIERREVLKNAEFLRETTTNSYYALYSQENSIYDALQSITSSLQKASDVDSSLNEPLETLNEIKFSLKEASTELRNYSDNLDINPQELIEIEDRIDILSKLKRKYGDGIGLKEVLDKLETFKEEALLCDNSTENIQKLEKELNEISSKLGELASELSNSRQKLADELSLLVTDEIKKLEMPYAEFKISISETILNQKGKDLVEFMIITNSGENFKPLAKIASGGEISRVMLAIKTIFAKSDCVETIIFDEIDTGISGKTSQAIANELSELSKTHQILCITHQPIIAGVSELHLHVSKEQNLLGTKVSINKLGTTQKLEVIAKMASGEINNESLEFAKTLLK